MIDLIAALKELGVKVYIVTASIKWAIEPAAKLVGLTADDVLGIQTEVDAKGVITERATGAVTWREGKVTGLLQATGNRSAFFSAGNTTGDLFLLKHATHLALAQSLASPTASYYRSEQDLQSEAKKHNWYRISDQ